MKLLVDECCDAGLVAALRADGHDVLYAQETPRGVTDDQILKYANQEDRILLTEDKDFGELGHRLKRPSHGIILLRFDVVDQTLKVTRLQYVLKHHSNQLHSSFAVIDKDKVRLRPLRKP